MAVQESESSTMPQAPPAPERPYSIFDSREKALIVLLVSIAATCKPIAIEYKSNPSLT